MITVTLYCNGQDSDCQAVKALLSDLETEFPHRVIEIDINRDRALKKAFETRVPLLQIGPYQLEGEFTVQRLRVALGAATDRVSQLEKIGDQGYRDRVARGQVLTGGDRLSLWISKNYIHVFNVLIFIYVGLPFLAPVLVRNGAVSTANLIYRVYSVVCHQLPFRSWFLYGEQAFYPRQLAGIEGVISYEQATHEEKIDVFNDRWFIGNAQLGYKVALCQRDVAIYGSMLIFGIGFALSGRRIKTLPWYLWVVIGLGPIALDGFSQLPGIIGNLPAWLPVRESTPLLRTLTGSLFGVMTAWYLYPMIEETMLETRRIITRKMATVEQLATKAD